MTQRIEAKGQAVIPKKLPERGSWSRRGVSFEAVDDGIIVRPAGLDMGHAGQGEADRTLENCAPKSRRICPAFQ